MSLTTNGAPQRLSYRIKELTALTGLSAATIYREIEAGQLVTSKIGRGTIILHEDAMAWLQARRGVTSGRDSATGGEDAA